MAGTAQMNPGEWINLVGVICVGLGLIWQIQSSARKEGELAERVRQQEIAIAEVKATAAKHTEQLSEGKARFATITEKLNTVLTQQDRLIASIDKALEQLG